MAETESEGKDVLMQTLGVRGSCNYYRGTSIVPLAIYIGMTQLENIDAVVDNKPIHIERVEFPPSSMTIPAGNSFIFYDSAHHAAWSTIIPLGKYMADYYTRFCAVLPAERFFSDFPYRQGESYVFEGKEYTESEFRRLTLERRRRSSTQRDFFSTNTRAQVQERNVSISCSFGDTGSTLDDLIEFHASAKKHLNDDPEQLIIASEYLLFPQIDHTARALSILNHHHALDAHTFCEGGTIVVEPHCRCRLNGVRTYIDTISLSPQTICGKYKERFLDAFRKPGIFSWELSGIEADYAEFATLRGISRPDMVITPDMEGPFIERLSPGIFWSMKTSNPHGLFNAFACCTSEKHNVCLQASYAGQLYQSHNPLPSFFGKPIRTYDD